MNVLGLGGGGNSASGARLQLTSCMTSMKLLASAPKVLNLLRIITVLTS